MTGTVLVVTSGKGGVGKTTTALNLGVALRGDGHSVALVDADLGMANLALMLGIDTEPTLHDVLAGAATIEEATVEEVEGFGVVPGGRDLGDFAAIDPGGLRAVIDTLAKGFEYVVVDAGPGLHYESTKPIEAADGVLLVTTPTDTAVGDTRKIAELAGLMEGSIFGAVLNRARDDTDPDAVAARLDVEVLAVVPEDRAVTESADAGVPLEQYASDNPAAAAFRRLAEVLADRTEPVSATPAGDQGTPGGSSAATGSVATEETSGTDGEDESDDEPGSRADPSEASTVTGTDNAAETASESESSDADKPEQQDANEEVGDDDKADDETGGIFARLRSLF